MPFDKMTTTANETDKLLDDLKSSERIFDAAKVVHGAHPEHGDTLVILHTNGTATVFFDNIKWPDA